MSNDHHRSNKTRVISVSEAIDLSSDFFRRFYFSLSLSLCFFSPDKHRSTKRMKNLSTELLISSSEDFPHLVHNELQLFLPFQWPRDRGRQRSPYFSRCWPLILPFFFSLSVSHHDTTDLLRLLLSLAFFLLFFTWFLPAIQLRRMCSTLEPRRATVSCKNLFTTTTADRSVPASSSSSSVRRSTHNTTTPKRTHHVHNNSSRPAIHSSKQPMNSHLAHASVVHVPFTSESIHDNKHYKSLPTALNPLSPAFHSTRQPSLSFQPRMELSHPR